MDNVPPPPPPPAPFGYPSPGYPPPRSRNWLERNWPWFVPTGCVALLVTAALFVGALMFMVMGTMKSSDAYKIAVGRARADKRVAAALGTPIAEGAFLSGTTSVAGDSGWARLAIPLSGPKAKGTLYVVAFKSGGKWDYSGLRVRVAGSGEGIDLLVPEFR